MVDQQKNELSSDDKTICSYPKLREKSESVSSGVRGRRPRWGPRAAPKAGAGEGLGVWSPPARVIFEKIMIK